MGRAPCCDKANVKKGPWSPEEDAKLKEFIGKYGIGGNWIALPQKAGLKRCGKSCRWSVIAAQLPGRTDNDIKNYWNTKLKKKLLTMHPSLQEKQTIFSSMPFQPPPFDHHTSHQLLNNSSSFYPFTPNFMNVDNNSNSLYDHNNVSDLQSPPPPANNLMTNNSIDVNDNCLNYLGFQDDHYSMCNSPILMFGSTSSSSEGGNYNYKYHEQKQQYQIKQEDYQITLDDQVLGDQVQNQSFMINNHVTPLHNNLEEVKQLNFTSYLFHDGDENMTSYYQKGTCSYYH
ncbi:hypothetical protein L1987_04699 [Smallanthus sonchifolius]|uniref:Uncharacterized protein n=1 Tax=Smallanthus sonchifolius TaxID=185202 RepID=A0ACB9JTA5_9ASTR|nr:hypothetical protein L1987_04699 [Smallanthus sonchifolius]